MEGHATAGVEREVDGVGSPHHVEPEPVRVVRSVALRRSQKALRGGVGAHDERYVTGTGENLAPGDRQSGHA